MPTRSAPTCNLSAASKAALTSCSLGTSSNSAVRPSVRAVARVSSHRDDIDLIRVHAESARELVEGGEHPDRAKRKIPFEDRASIARRGLLRFARLDSRAFTEA